MGTIQLNYYGSLYAGRTSEFGTPRHFALSGASNQAHAMHTLWRGRGNFDDWSTYTSGAYKQYLHGKVPPGPRPGGNPPPNTQINPPTEDYSGTLRKAAPLLTDTGNTFKNVSLVLRGIRDTNPH